MAEIKGVKSNPTGLTAIQVITWEEITENDTATFRANPLKADKTVTFTGSFGGATGVLKGSNDGTNWYTLNDPTGTAISLIEGGMRAVLENPLYIKPEFSGGTSQDVDVILVAVGG